MERAYHQDSQACLNCGTVPAGRWCQNCGQKSGPAHRSVLDLMRELAELTTHADSRLWRTMTALVLRPATLTRDFLLGRRASQIPPLRLFFVVLLVLFTAGSLTRHGMVSVDLPAADRQQVEKAINGIHTRSPRLEAWLKPHLLRAVNKPEAVVEVIREWLERFTLLMLPIAASLLWVLTVGVRPRFTFFDHMIFATHSLSFAGLVQIAVFLLGTLIPASGVLLLVLPVHLFRHMRGVYGGGVALTLLRMTILGLGSLFAVAVLFVILAWMGLQFAAD
ncbi:DUF3667 domain-containing protein [Acetobacteraceae bacterium KSS8]|uniref:DUF3667 domain-containing protein n=1 Tax=Endosaccharibacter trunci TaxID=2812733 RepID=A0ABT1W994_9PROT|nr:DUF3667 domain-containing protein [Acetobacteraceae bacterium KSS8]